MGRGRPALAIVVCAFTLLAACGSSTETRAGSVPTRPPILLPTVPPTIRVGSVVTPAGSLPFKTLTFCTPAGHGPLYLNLFVPSGPGPFPVVVRAHGGAWIRGDRADGPRPSLVAALVTAGFALASVDYRLAPAKFPAPVEDVACAVRFLRAHAAQLRLDPQRVGGMGDSAGGQLVALLANGGAPALPAGAEYPFQPSRLRAVVTISAIMRFDAQLLQKLPLTKGVFNSEDLKEMNRYAPIEHVSKSSPPFLIIHGENDRLVSVKQAIDFNHALTSVGAKSELVLVRHAGHELLADGGVPSPTMEEIEAKILGFFTRYLAS